MTVTQDFVLSSFETSVTLQKYAMTEDSVDLLDTVDVHAFRFEFRNFLGACAGFVEIVRRDEEVHVGFIDPIRESQIVKPTVNEKEFHSPVLPEKMKATKHSVRSFCSLSLGHRRRGLSE